MIRKMTHDDLPKVLPLIKEIHKLHFEKLPKFIRPYHSDDEILKNLDTMFKQDGYFHFVYEMNGEIVAFMDMSINPSHDDLLFYGTETLFLDSLVVDPLYRKHGIAGKMIEYAKKHAKELGFRSLQLFVLTHFEHVHQYYQKLGFQDVSYLMTYDLNE
ncbi:MAG: GNAT family N-acetyltransferase [Brevinema sp.]